MPSPGVFFNGAKLLQPFVNWACKPRGRPPNLLPRRMNLADACSSWKINSRTSRCPTNPIRHVAPLIDLFACPHLRLLLNCHRASRRSRLIFCCLVSRKKKKGCSVIELHPNARRERRKRRERRLKEPHMHDAVWTDVGQMLKSFFPAWKRCLWWRWGRPRPHGPVSRQHDWQEGSLETTPWFNTKVYIIPKK